VDRPSIFEYAGGAPAFRALAADFHARCLADPILEHPFSHTSNPDHVQRLGDYWGEVFGGPALFTAAGGHSAMLGLHANMGAEDSLGARFVEVFDEAVRSAPLPRDPELQKVLHDYMQWATDEVMTYSGATDAVVPPGLDMPRWSWSGLHGR
jgi:hemoglobin